MQTAKTLTIQIEHVDAKTFTTDYYYIIMPNFLDQLDPKTKAKTMWFIKSDETLASRMPAEEPEMEETEEVEIEESGDLMSNLEKLKSQFADLSEQDKLSFISQLLA